MWLVWMEWSPLNCQVLKLKEYTGIRYMILSLLYIFEIKNKGNHVLSLKMGVCWTWLFSLPWRFLSVLSVILWVGEHVLPDSHPAGAPFSPKYQSQGPSSSIFLKTPSLLPLKPLKLGFPWPQTSYTESPHDSESICWGRPSLSILLQMQNHPSSITISLSLYSFASIACITMETSIYTVHWLCVCMSFSPS